MNARRTLLVTLGASVFANGFTRAQQPPTRMRRVGYLTGGNAQANAAWLTAFRAGLAALRWVEGRDYVIDARYANGVAQVVPRLAAELVATQPDLLLVAGEGGLRPLIALTKTIPIVFAQAQDPVGSGLVASLRRPGANATGFTILASGLGAKRLQLLREALPRIAHVVALYEPDNAAGVSQKKEIEAAAGHLKLRVTAIELRQPADVEPAFKRGAALGAQACIVTLSGGINSLRSAIAEHALRLELPMISGLFEFTEAGGLMSYGASYTDNYRRAAGYVDKIFKGANPGELPIQQPVTFELVLNMKTARALGVTFPHSTMLQANRVIE